MEGKADEAHFAGRRALGVSPICQAFAPFPVQSILMNIRYPSLLKISFVVADLIISRGAYHQRKLAGFEGSGYRSVDILTQRLATGPILIPAGSPLILASTASFP
jgi:hypothetical protein